MSDPVHVLAAIEAAKGSEPHKSGTPCYKCGAETWRHWDVERQENSTHVKYRVEKFLGIGAVPSHATVATRWWVYDECVYDLISGHLVMRNVWSHHSHVAANGYAGDICYNCGTDNGPNGESRQGFDCCYCGGN